MSPHTLVLCFFVFSCCNLLGQDDLKDSLLVKVQRHSLEPINIITVSEASTGRVLDSLMLIDGRVELLDYYLSNLDTITMVYYQHHLRDRRTLWTQFIFDEKTKYYVSRTVIIHNYFQSSQTTSGYGAVYDTGGISDDADYFRNFNLEGHNAIKFDQRVDLNIDEFVNRTYGFYDVEHLKNAGIWLITNK